MEKVKRWTKLNNIQCHFKWEPTDGDIDADPQKGIPHMEANLNSYPNKKMALLLIGYLNTKLHIPNYPDALRAFDTVLNEPLSSLESPEERRGYEIMALGNKAHVLVLSGDTTRAKSTIAYVEDDFSALHPKTRACILANHAFALTLFGPPKLKRSIELYCQALNLDCENFAILEGFAFSYGRYRRYEQGNRSKPTKIEQLVMLQAIKISKWKVSCPIVLLADLLFLQGRAIPSLKIKGDSRYLDIAKELFNRAYALDPHCPNVLMRCGKAFHIMGEMEFGLKCLHEAVELDPHSSAAKFKLGQCYAFYKKDKEKLRLAEKYLKEAITMGRRRHLFAEIEYGKVRKRLDWNFDLERHLEDMKIKYIESDGNISVIEKEIEKIAQYRKAKQVKRNSANENQRGTKKTNKKTDD